MTKLFLLRAAATAAGVLGAVGVLGVAGTIATRRAHATYQREWLAAFRETQRVNRLAWGMSDGD